MLFECPKCATRYQESEEVLKSHQFRVKCARCQEVFMARDPNTSWETDPEMEVTFEEKTQAHPGPVEFDDPTVADGKAGPVRFDDLTDAQTDVEFADHTTIDQPEDPGDEPMTQVADQLDFEDETVTLQRKPPVEFDDKTDPDTSGIMQKREKKLPVPPVQDFSTLPDLSTPAGIFDDDTNRGVIKPVPAVEAPSPKPSEKQKPIAKPSKPAREKPPRKIPPKKKEKPPEKPPDTIIPEIDEDIFSDRTRHATPSRELLEKALPDLVDVDRSEEKTKPE